LGNLAQLKTLRIDPGVTKRCCAAGDPGRLAEAAHPSPRLASVRP
jgi:hypothetical protein